jgi:AcrR family transcriptional regulator
VLHRTSELVRAALDLFTEQGYDNTTVAQIGERAGLTKTTFFRHFPDEREVLFAGQDTHGRLLADGIAAAMTDALHERGVPDPAASLAADLGVRAFYGTFARWIDPASQETFTELARQALSGLRAVATTLG